MLLVVVVDLVARVDIKTTITLVMAVRDMCPVSLAVR
jgi:hypothetical protein